MAGLREEAAQFVRALSFGSVADQYELYRPGYPDELVDVVVQHAGRPLRSAVEVGAGTGKATCLFASQGVHVTALEPDPEMAVVLRRTSAGLSVTTVENTFENYHSTDSVDLVFAAAAWHWTDPATRTARAAELLAPGGVLALFGSSVHPADPDLCAAIGSRKGDAAVGQRQRRPFLGTRRAGRHHAARRRRRAPTSACRDDQR